MTKHVDEPFTEDVVAIEEDVGEMAAASDEEANYWFTINAFLFLLTQYPAEQVFADLDEQAKKLRDAKKDTSPIIVL